jgi:CheY-like chemotaxis protein
VSGEEFLAYASEGRAPEPAPALLDIHMPRMKGFEALSRFRDDGRLDHVPVVIPSSGRNPADRERAMDMGLNRSASKTASIDEYIELFGSLEPLPC